MTLKSHGVTFAQRTDLRMAPVCVRDLNPNHMPNQQSATTPSTVFTAPKKNAIRTGTGQPVNPNQPPSWKNRKASGNTYGVNITNSGKRSILRSVFHCSITMAFAPKGVVSSNSSSPAFRASKRKRLATHANRQPVIIAVAKLIGDIITQLAVVGGRN